MDGAPLARVVLLGGFAVELDGTDPGSTLADLPRGVQRLVAYLGLADRPTRAAVAGHLWPDVPEEHALGSLRSALWRLHKVAPGLVEVSGGALSLAPGVRVDVREFTQWAHLRGGGRGATAGERAPNAGPDPPGPGERRRSGAGL